jgi:hypothetical protein
MGVTIDRDHLSRTVKLEIDDGTARTFAEAVARADSYVLQIVVGDDVAGSATREAMLLTAVNSARRAFPGGVHVTTPAGTLTCRWALDATVADAVERLGGTITDATDDAHPTLIIGTVGDQISGSAVLHLTWNSWCGGVVTAADARLGEGVENVLAGVFAGALGVSELFQHRRGSIVAGLRDAGLSLWSPDLDWRDPNALGPELTVLPASWWLIGLGHLGQAYAWTIGLLPYADPRDVLVQLQDVDVIVPANVSTSLLAEADDEAVFKTRMVASRLESIGFRTRIVERLFDDGTVPQPGEPIWALSGFDKPAPRRLLDRFSLAVDAGLGSGPEDYLDILVQTFPGPTLAADAFPETGGRSVNVDRPAYDAAVSEATRAGVAEGDARCGIVDVAGAAVGAAFVGAAASVIVIAEAVRELVGGPSFSAIALNLKDPRYADVAAVGSRPPSNPGMAPTDR